MDADKLLGAFSDQELQQLHAALPAELERRGLDLRAMAGGVAVDSAAGLIAAAEIIAAGLEIDTESTCPDNERGAPSRTNCPNMLCSSVHCMRWGE